LVESEFGVRIQRFVGWAFAQLLTCRDVTWRAISKNYLFPRIQI